MATAETVQPKTYVGFDSITSQIEKKLLKRGFQFNVMCVGMLLVLLVYEDVRETILTVYRTNWAWKVDSD